MSTGRRRLRGELAKLTTDDQLRTWKRDLVVRVKSGEVDPAVARAELWMLNQVGDQSPRAQRKQRREYGAATDPKQLLVQLEQIADVLQAEGLQANVPALLTEYHMLLGERMAEVALHGPGGRVNRFLELADRVKVAEAASRLIGSMPRAQRQHPVTADADERFAPQVLSNGGVVVWVSAGQADTR